MLGDFFGSIYCWLEDFFGLELADYLWGISSPLQQRNMYIGIGLSMLGISLFAVICYYYIINHPRLNNWWGWLIFLVANALINFFIGWQLLMRHYYAGRMVKEDPTNGALVPLNISEGDILAFGVTNMIDATIAFFIFSYIIKWWSTNCSRAPF